MKICITEAVWESYQTRLFSVAPQAEVLRLSREGQFSGSADDVDAFFFSEDLYRAPRATVEAALGVATSGIRWVHSSSAGIDHPIFQAVLDSGAILTHSPGLHSKPIAEYVFGHILSQAKNLAAHAGHQKAHAWTPLDSVELTERTIGIVGYGGIGAAVARLAKAFEMRVIATKRSGVDDPNLDERMEPSRLLELLASSDYVVLTVPLTDESKGMIGAAELAAMKSDALLINVARGSVVDSEALLAALSEGRIGGAVLDVTAPEPLPSDSPLWDLPNVTITPHDSGDSRFAFERTGDFWLKNLARYVRGEPLVNVATSIELTNDSPRRRELGLPEEDEG